MAKANMVEINWSVWGRSVSYYGEVCSKREVPGVLAALRQQAAGGRVFGYVTVNGERVSL